MPRQPKKGFLSRVLRRLPIRCMPQAVPENIRVVPLNQLVQAEVFFYSFFQQGLFSGQPVFPLYSL